MINFDRKETSFDEMGRGGYESSEDKVSKNYYPITTAIAIRDNFTQMTVMNDRTQGGSSLQNGTIELMQNRRILADD
jgi:lysosomal alpha-mannosidase